MDGDDATNRIDEYGIDSLACALPDSDALIVGYFYRIGLCLNVGMGTFPVSYSEIAAFSSMQADSLSEFESEQIAMMSREYCNWLGKSKDRHYLAPWNHEDYDPIVENRKRVLKQVVAMRESRNNFKA